MLSMCVCVRTLCEIMTHYGNLFALTAHGRQGEKRSRIRPETAATPAQRNAACHTQQQPAANNINMRACILPHSRSAIAAYSPAPVPTIYL